MRMQFLKIRQFSLLFIILFLFLMNGSGQLKSFQLTSTGDTINAVLNNGQKHGKWVVQVPEKRGEPGYEEEGVYDSGKKVGVWRMYTSNGDPIGFEQYKYGAKDGIQQYYTFLGQLVREESWRSYNPNAPYDTIPIYGQNSDQIVDYKIEKAVDYSVKNGEWKFYDPETGKLIKSETWDRGTIVPPNQPVKTEATAAASDKPKKIEKTAEMLKWDKDNKGKKKAWRDGRTSN